MFPTYEESDLRAMTGNEGRGEKSKTQGAKSQRSRIEYGKRHKDQGEGSSQPCGYKEVNARKVRKEMIGSKERKQKVTIRK